MTVANGTAGTSRDPFTVARAVDLMGRLVDRRHRLWIRLGELETKLLYESLADHPALQPVYIAGLARSGSTILLEVLASLDQVVTHRYSDFPFTFTPFWWNWLRDRMPGWSGRPVERAHGDGMLVTPDSAEAMEEPLWMAFFPHLHDAAATSILDGETTHPDFERFYRDHIRKLLAVRCGQRYVSKANYNITRMEYLLTIFPDARFVVPIREPANHVASLMRQHDRFTSGQNRNPRAIEYLRRVGHFEFGLDRRPINTDTEDAKGLLELWNTGQEVTGWARYWGHVYGYVAERIRANERLREATAVISLEDLQRSPKEMLVRLLHHCGLEQDEKVVADVAGRIKTTTSCSSRFSKRDLDIITDETRDIARSFGY